MSIHHGPQGKSAAKRMREVKRSEAETRQQATLPQNTKRYRLDPAQRLLVETMQTVGELPSE